jgi:cell wall-associated NlpC family hydrolase
VNELADRLQAAVARVREQLGARYPVLVDSTLWAAGDGLVTVSGGVLVQAMAEAYAAELGAALAPVPVPRPLVLCDLDAPWQVQHWLPLVGDPAVDVHRGPSGDELQTQWTPPAWIRFFADHAAGRSLVQLPDGTLGWVDGARVGRRTNFPVADPWAGIRRGAEGRMASASGRPRQLDGRPVSPLEDLAARARARRGRPYRWGGNTDAGADCSAFVQSLLWEAAGVLLPKHTGDQRRLGLRVGLDSLRPGDLLFVRGREKGLAHVGLVLSAEGAGAGGEPRLNAVHSCLSRGCVLEEPLPEFLDRYEFSGVRRVVDWGEPS